MKNLILIPDVHGRTFWRKLVEKYKNKEDYEIIFFGDYLDPYPFEGINGNAACTEFFDIIQEARTANNIVLLLGNHDLHYLPQFLSEWGCRRINDRKNEISEYFDLNLFKVAHSAKVAGKTYLFTHAGVTKPWYQLITGKITHGTNTFCELMEIPEDEKRALESTPLTVDGLNSLTQTSAGLEALRIVSRERGGNWNHGSCVWADISEHIWNDDSDLNEYGFQYQIFAHNLTYPTVNDFYRGLYCAMIDNGHGFLLNSDTGELTEIKNDVDDSYNEPRFFF
jgi:predicted phosphodiesterase